MLPMIVLSNSTHISGNWMKEKHKKFELAYTHSDKQNKKEYVSFINIGIDSVDSFFSDDYKKSFSVIIHPNRHSLDSAWKNDWKMPDFTSECWMVASGVADKLDMISPKQWKEQSCEHDDADKIKTQQLITHELVHVFHGQLNKSPDFSDVSGIDWFAEGLAAFASGQCDTEKILSIKKLIADKKNPIELDNFWKGKYRYWLSGSMVMFIDHAYGRATIIKLLPFNNKTEILSYLHTTEAQLINDWSKYIEKL